MDGDMTKAAATFTIPGGGLAMASGALGKAAERAQAIMAANFETFGAETTRYFEGLSSDSRAAMQAFAKCAGPADVLLAEQAWLTARTKANLDLALRMAQAFGDAVKVASGPPDEVNDKG